MERLALEFSRAMASAAEAPIATSSDADDFDFDVDDLLQSFRYNDLFDVAADIWIPEPPPPPSTTMEEEKSSDSPSPDSGGSCDTVKSYASHLEKVLMEEEGEDAAAVKEISDINDFIACLFAEGSRDGGSEASTPESAEEVLREEKEVEETPATVSAEGEDDDPVSKKLRRQMRNRDSAMKSRERKKIYVKELEMKSKYLETECRRLDYALRCCAAENLVLRQCLQKERPFDASAAKQESAVLFEESLPLGSLIWLASIICLFLLPVLPILNLKGTGNTERGRDHEIVVIERVTTETPEKNINSGFRSVSFGKRCRGTRTRIKDLAILNSIEAS